MGATCRGMSVEDKKAADQSRHIDKELSQAKKKSAKEVKLLLLGAGASGKSTVAKQMHIIYLNGFGERELTEYKQQLKQNMVANMKALLRGANNLGIPISDSLEKEKELLMDITASEEDPEVEWSEELYKALKVLWSSDGINAAFKRSNEFQLNDSADFFFENLDQYKDLDSYRITDEDILHIRKRTTGILETKFSYSDRNFTMVDVGGQRNERRKWIHCFEDVTAIIFVTALSEYDQVLEEDQMTNRMVESLKLFEDTINNAWFQKKPIILFLNKVDIFEKKIQHSNIGDYFTDYKGGADVDKAKRWIEEQFKERNHSPVNARPLYVHMTMATNTNNIRMVFDACRDIWLSEALDAFSF